MKKGFRVAFIILMLVILYLPILILAVYSFTDSANIGTIHGFSVQNYVTLFTKPELADMIWGYGSSCGWISVNCDIAWNTGCGRCILFQETCIGDRICDESGSSCKCRCCNRFFNLYLADRSIWCQ